MSTLVLRPLLIMKNHNAEFSKLEQSIFNMLCTTISSSMLSKIQTLVTS
jgi:hypothetical protein